MLPNEAVLSCNLESSSQEAATFMRTRFVRFVMRIVKQQGTADFHESNVDGGAKSQEAHNLNSIVTTIVFCASVRNTGSLVSQMSVTLS